MVVQVQGSSSSTYDSVCYHENNSEVTNCSIYSLISGAPEFTPVFSGVHVTWSLVLYICFVDRYLSFCTLYLLAIILLRYTDSDYLFWYLQTLLLSVSTKER